MEVEWMMLANHAEIPPNGLLYLSGATWDTLNVEAPLPDGAPDGVVSFFQGMLVARLGLHSTETNRQHRFHLRVLTADGAEVGAIVGEFGVDRDSEHPAGWPQAGHVVVSLTGLPLPDFGFYTIALAINDDHKAERPFRVVKRY
jgi:hypothetical protein